jgi:hypothetical protein
MKAQKFKNRMALLLMLTIILSCVKVDDFELPSINPIAPEIDGTIITINTLLNLLYQEQENNENDMLSFYETDLYISGYVISSDEAGNFFEELIIQDSPENPTRGIKILIDVNPLFVSFEFGRKVIIRLDGLALGFDSGVLSLGIEGRDKLEKIAESLMTETIIRDIEIADIVPTPIAISEFSKDKTNLYIQLNNVQFNQEEVLGIVPKTFAAEPSDAFDGERKLESCVDGTSTVFSTSTFADFKAVLLPKGNGILEGILSQNFFGDEFNIVVNSPETIYFENNVQRCELDCGRLASTGPLVLFNDFFETMEEGQPISGNGWTNFIEAGSEYWEAYFDDDVNTSLGISARVGSFYSNDERTISWLISPEINFDNQDGESLQFKTSTSFADSSKLEVLFSDNWDGNENTIRSATWKSFPSAIIASNNDFFGDWIESGYVDFSCFNGKGHFAWRYTGSGEEDFDGTYELDEIIINSN